jgi:hypothetical protein
MDNNSAKEPTQLELEFDNNLSDSSLDLTFGTIRATPYPDVYTMSSHHIDSITLSSVTPSITIPPLTVSTMPSSTGAQYASSPYIISTGATSGPTWSTISPSPNLTVAGDAEFGGDIKIKGKSLNDVLDHIEQRLAILRPNTELESEWDELRELGERYRKLEAEFEEKSRVWKALKQ